MGYNKETIDQNAGYVVRDLLQSYVGYLVGTGPNGGALERSAFAG